VIYALSTDHKVGLGLVALAWIVFSLVVAMVIPRYKPDFPGKNLPAFLGVIALFFVAMLFSVAYFGKESKESEAAAPPTTATTTAATTTTSTAPAVDLAAGKAAWDKASCGGCHTLKAAGGSGNVGPNLDDLKPDEATVAHQVENGGGAMPPFKGVLTPDEIHAVAVYVSSQAGKA
jgi:mono/diheme cytochrome c family protein